MNTSVASQNQRMRTVPFGEDFLPAVHAKPVVIGMGFLHLQFEPVAGFEVDVNHRADELFTDDGAGQSVAPDRLRGQVDMLGADTDSDSLSGDHRFTLRQPRQEFTVLRIEANQSSIVEADDRAAEDVFAANELGDEAVVRFKKNLLRRADLFNPAPTHDHHSIGHCKRFGLTVSDVDEGDAQVFLQSGQHALHAHAQMSIERAQWLVE